MNDYLLEIGMEEMPALAIVPAQNQLKSLVQDYCTQSKIHFQSIQCFSTPKRLAVLVEQIADYQEDQHLESKGPSLEIAQNHNGEWTKAAHGFAKKHSVEVEQLKVQKIQGKEFVFVHQEIKGQESKILFQSQLQKWIWNLSFPKSMRWGTGDFSYVRPIHWIISLWNDEVLPVQVEEIQAERITYGLRHTDKIEIGHAQHYESSFEKIIVSYEKRKQAIVEQIHQLEQANQFHVDINEELLHEVTNLVEYPTVLQGCFDQKFLNVPSQALSMAMSHHQRYFSVYDAQGQMLPQFLLVAQCSKHDTVIQGNEKVLNARLKDAQFFYENDCKRTPDEFVKQLANVTFFQERGSLLDRTNRIVQQVEQVCPFIFDDDHPDYSKMVKSSQRVAELAFFDLQTQMVYEFPELQGVMGEQYALLHGESAPVARGLKERYWPQFYGDALPSDGTTLPVSLLEKMDLIVTVFSTGKKPSGSSDPYALRRAANSIIQILFGKNISIPLKNLIPSFENFAHQPFLDDLVQFFKERMIFAIKQQNIRHDFIEAVTATLSLKSVPYWQLCLAKELVKFSQHEKFKAAIESIVRTINIVQANRSEIESQVLDWNPDLAKTEPEQKLHQKTKDFCNWNLNPETFCERLLDLEPYITAFFDSVMILDKNDAVRKNRLYLCYQISNDATASLDFKKIELV